MMRIVASEFLKYKRTFTRKLILIAPLTVAVMVFFVGLGDFYQNGCYNIWYMFFLPAFLVLACSGIVMKDQKKLHNHAVLALPVKPEKIMLGKILIGVLFSFIACMLFPLIILPGVFKDAHWIPILLSFWSSLLLFLTTAWLVPFSFFLIEHLGTPVTVLLQVGLYSVCAVFLTETDFWWVPYAIPARLMCAVIQVRPNGLSVPAGDALLSPTVILSGIFITLALFAFMTMITVQSYRNMEAK